ncbi:unnamed protein product, partial [Amoebophrya sp. A120]|eukprot:GSA120T00026395001.1
MKVKNKLKLYQLPNERPTCCKLRFLQLYDKNVSIYLKRYWVHNCRYYLLIVLPDKKYQATNMLHLHQHCTTTCATFAFLLSHRMRNLKCRRVVHIHFERSTVSSSTQKRPYNHRDDRFLGFSEKFFH